jgi:uncharacterized protein
MPDSGLSLTAPRTGTVGLRWAGMIALSAVFVLLLEMLHLPAALLLGPMAAGIVLTISAGAVRVPQPPIIVAQAVLGCMIARNIPVSIIGEIAREWPIFVAAILSVSVASTALGWLLMRMRVLPGTTAIWGSSPGAATIMTLMSEAYGGDIRLVAFMQYLRVVLVAVLATVVAAVATAGAGGAIPKFIWFPPVIWPAFAATMTVATLAVLAARLLRLPAGPLLVPLFTCVVLQDAGLLKIELPPLLLAASYAVIGWSIGLRFTRTIIMHAARALPRVFASTLALIAICGVFAAILVELTGVDPLTAYLATSPGGADSVAIIAASSNVDVPFVMAMQTARLVIVLLTAPSLARFMAKRSGAVAGNV